MSGSIGYWLKFRVTPTDGDAFELDFGGIAPGGMLYMHAPMSLDVNGELLVVRDEDINRRLRPLYQGLRRKIKVELAIGGENSQVQNDHGMLMQIVNAFLNDGSTVECSLDNGQNYFEVVLVSAPMPDALARKWMIGAKYVLEVEEAEPRQFIPTLTDTYTEGVPSGF